MAAKKSTPKNSKNKNSKVKTQAKSQAKPRTKTASGRPSANKKTAAAGNTQKNSTTKKAAATKKAKPAAKKASAAPQYFSEAFTAPSAQAENVLQFGTNAMKQFLSGSTGEAKKAQEDAMAIGKETVQQFSTTADAATQSVEKAVSAGQENLEVSLEFSTVAVEISKKLLEELFQYTNKTFSDNVELSQEAFSCRTISDALDLQNKLIRTNLDNFFTESMQLSETLFQFASEATEPLAARVEDMAKSFSKGLAA